MPQEQVDETGRICQEFKRNKKGGEKKELNRKRGWGIIINQVF